MKSPSAEAMDLKAWIRDVPDFPSKGILFKDITPLLKEGRAFQYAVRQIAEPFRNNGIAVVVCVEARGFIFGSAIAVHLGAGLVPVRKKGKLPYTTIEETYSLEYGQDTLAIHSDAVSPGQKVLIVDDLLATGGTVQAAMKLLDKLKADVVGVGCLIELSFLKARDRLTGLDVHSVIKY